MKLSEITVDGTTTYEALPPGTKNNSRALQVRPLRVLKLFSYEDLPSSFKTPRGRPAKRERVASYDHANCYDTVYELPADVSGGKSMVLCELEVDQYRSGTTTTATLTRAFPAAYIRRLWSEHEADVAAQEAEDQRRQAAAEARGDVNEAAHAETLSHMHAFAAAHDLVVIGHGPARGLQLRPAAGHDNPADIAAVVRSTVRGAEPDQLKVTLPAQVLAGLPLPAPS